MFKEDGATRARKERSPKTINTLLGRETYILTREATTPFRTTFRTAPAGCTADLVPAVPPLTPLPSVLVALHPFDNDGEWAISIKKTTIRQGMKHPNHHQFLRDVHKIYWS